MAVSPEALSARERLHRIEALTDGALAYLDIDDLLAEILRRLGEVLDVDGAVLLLLDDSRSELLAKAAWGFEGPVSYRGRRVPLDHGFTGRIAREGILLPLEEVRPGDIADPALLGDGFTSLLGAPLIGQGEVIGVIFVGSLAPRSFLEEDVELLQAAGDRLALAVQADTAQAQLAAAKMLQHSLLPTTPPPITGLRLAARYVPGEGDAIGGDWYDVFALPSGHVCLAVGDVTGHGLPAAVVMGRLRSALRAYALTDLDPGAVVTQLDSKLRHFEAGQMATLLYAVLDPLLDRVHISSAGHLPAMLAAPGQATVALEGPADPPLGAGPGRPRRTTAFDVPSDAVLCLYTDGLVERRGTHIDDRLELLRSTIVPGEPDDVCAAVMGGLAGRAPLSDDIALLVVRRDETRHRSMTAVAEPASLAHIRTAVRRWLSGADATPTATDDLVIAVSEAAANCIRHAYGPAGGTIEVELALNDGDAIATVRDTGRWRPARKDNEPGRGLLLMERCSDDVQVAPGRDTGTEVTIRRNLWRDA